MRLLTTLVTCLLALACDRAPGHPDDAGSGGADSPWPDAGPPTLMSPTRGTHLTVITAWGSFSDDDWEIELRAGGESHTLTPDSELVVRPANNAASFHVPFELEGDVTVVSRAGGEERDHGVFHLESVVDGPVIATETVAAAGHRDGTTVMLGTEHGVPFLATLSGDAVRRWPERDEPPADGGVADAGIPADGGGVTDAGIPADGGVPEAGVAVDGGAVDAGVGPDGGSVGGEEPLSLTSAVVYGATDAPEAAAVRHPDEALLHLRAETGGELTVAWTGLTVDCVFGAGTDGMAAFVWVARGGAVERLRPADGWANDRGPIDLPAGAGCPELGGDGSILATWFTSGGGPFDDTATVWASHLEPGASAFTPREAVGGPYDDTITFMHAQATPAGHHLVSYCWTDSGIGGEGQDCTGPRLLRAPTGAEPPDLGLPIEGRTRPWLGGGTLLWTTNRTSHAEVELPSVLEDVRQLPGAQVGPVAISEEGTFHVPVVSLTETRILVIPASAGVED